MRPIALFAVAVCGCVPASFRVGTAPMDAHNQLVHNALGNVIPNAFEVAVRADGVSPQFSGGGSGLAGGESDWYRNVRYYDADAKPLPVPPERFVPIMQRVEEVVLKTLRGVPGVEVWEVVPTREAKQRPGAAGFVIRYGRRGGEVGGEVVGLIEPSAEMSGGFTRLKVIASEWVTQ